MRHRFLITLLGLLLAGTAGADTINLNPVDSIQGAIDSAQAGDVIHLNNGTYVPSTTINVNKGITIEGESETGVVISCGAVTGYGFIVSSHNVTLTNFTISPPDQNYPIHASGTTNLPNGYDNLTISHVTVTGAHRRTGFDINGYNHVVLSHLTSRDAYGGNGLQISGCIDVDIDNITTTNNAWGSLAVYVSKPGQMNRGSQDVTIDGNTLVLGEGYLFMQDEQGLFNTNVVVQGYEYYVRNTSFRELVGELDSNQYTIFRDSLSDAVTLALSWPGHEHHSSIEEISTGDFVVSPGMSIQAAIDAAGDGDSVNVAAGTFREQLRIAGKSLALNGAGAALTILEAPDPVDRTPVPVTKWNGTPEDIDAVVLATGPATVHVADLKIDGRDTGPNHFYGVYYLDIMGSVSDCVIANIQDGAAPSNDRVVSLVATHTPTGSCDIDVLGNTIPEFQKGGILVMGPAAVCAIEGNSITNAVSNVLAGNGIQVSYGASGALADNIVNGVAYSGEDWSATGILLFESGDVSLDGDSVLNCQTGVNYSDWRWGYAMPTPVDLAFTGLTLTNNAWSLGAQLSGDQSDLNLTVTGGTISGSTGDAVDIYGSGASAYYAGWANGDLNVHITGLTVAGATYDGIWADDLSGNASNTVHSFEVRQTSFDGCTNAVNNDLDDTIDARLCYWGATTGPTTSGKSNGAIVKRALPSPAECNLPGGGGVIVHETSGDKAVQNVDGDVVFAGWLEDKPALLGARPWTLHTSVEAGGITPAVQIALPGEEIAISAGTYTEPVLLDKKVDLLGAGSGENPASNTIITNTGVHCITINASGYSQLDPLLLKNLRIEPNNSYGINVTLATYSYLKLDNVFVDGNDPIDDTENNIGLKVSTEAGLSYLDILGCSFDHLAYGWYFAKHGDWGPGGTNVAHVNVANTTFSHNQAKGIYVEKLTDATFTNCVVDDNGRDSGFWNSAFNAGVDINLKGDEPYSHYVFTNCIVTNNAHNAKEGVGFTIKGRGTGSDTGGGGAYGLHQATVTDVVIQGGTYTGNERGIRFGEPGMNNTTPTGVVVSGVVIANNVKTYGGSDGSAYGGFVNATSAQNDARGNWWGDATGPYNSPHNLSGLGNAVVGDVLFDPWRTGVIVPTPDPLDLTAAQPSGDIEVSYLGGAGTIYGYSVDVQWNPLIADADDIEFTKPATGPFAAGNVVFGVVHVGAGHVIVDAGLPGNQPGILSGPLFDVHFTAVAGAGETVLNLATPWIFPAYNSAPIADIPTDDGRIRVDTGLPAVTGTLITDTTIGSTSWVKNGDTVQVTATVVDASPITVTCNLTGFLGPLATAVPWTAQAGDLYTWTFVATTCSPANGTVNVAVTATDNLGNVASGSDSITADNILPSPLTGVVTLPGHQKIHVSWNDAAGQDTNYAGVAFRYVVRGDYPQYVNAVPAYPATHLEGAAAFTATGATTNWPMTPRDIYYLAGFVYDHAGNYSVTDVSPTNRDAATNYWLGDVSPVDGEVTVLDVSTLGDTYGLTEGSVMPPFTFNPHCDVGPTDDWSSFGLPMPDNTIGFFDLMVFAMNFGEVEFEGKSMTSGTSPDLTWHQIDETTWALTLNQECPGLKGLNLAAELPAGVTCQVQAGATLARQGAYFLKNISQHGLDAGLAVLGQNVAIDGAGDLVVVTFSAPVANLDLEIQARDTANAELLVEMSGTTGVELPTVFSLAQNYPNPFNPQTTITFALPRNEHVRLAVYSVDGARVRTLVDESFTAGTHDVVWDGRDGGGRIVATGTYFYMIDAGDFHQVRKMVLMK